MALQSLVYFNAIVVPLKNIEDQQTQKIVSWCISRIVTLEKQLSPGVGDTVEAMERVYDELLAPMLLEPLAADGTNIEAAIEEKLRNYETALTSFILSKLTTAMIKLAKTEDDIEYLFANARMIIIELACDVRDFNTLSATSWSETAEELDLRIISYVRLFDKRKDQFLTAIDMEDGDDRDPLLDPDMPVKEYKRIIALFRKRLMTLNKELKHAFDKQAQLSQWHYRMLAMIMSLVKKPVTPEMVETNISTTNFKCLIELMKVCKRFPRITVYLEFEDLMTIDETKRHYALPMGDQGLARLPLMVVLLEDKAAFDISVLHRLLTIDILQFAPTQAWSETAI